MVFNYHQDKCFRFTCVKNSKHIRYIYIYIFIDNNSCLECTEK